MLLRRFLIAGIYRIMTATQVDEEILDCAERPDLISEGKWTNWLISVVSIDLECLIVKSFTSLV